MNKKRIINLVSFTGCYFTFEWFFYFVFSKTDILEVNSLLNLLLHFYLLSQNIWTIDVHAENYFHWSLYFE